MKLADPRFWIGVLSLGGVTLLSLESISRKSPGPLSSPHHRESELRSRFGCSECHGDNETTVQQACLDCHEPIAEHLELGQGLHGTLPDNVAQSCGLCHSEHHGRDFAIVNRRSFAIAGVGDVAAFDHNLIGFAMDGAHLDLSCTECHENAEVEVLPKGEHRYLGLDQSCTSCHESPHQGKLTSCTDCHGQTAWDQLDNFTHTEEFPLVGAHSNPSCLACHERGYPHAVEILANPKVRRKPAMRQCADCHESPHANLFVKRIAAMVDEFEPDAACITCHKLAHESFRPDEGLTITPRQHRATGFLLNRPHNDLACADCHQPVDGTFEERHPGREAQDCAACHDDPHDGQFEVEPFLEQGCLSCHKPHEWEGHTFDLERHAQTNLPLEGAHAQQDCYACHQEPHPGAARLFHGTASRCEACHEDAHRGFFGRFQDTLAAEPRGDCAVCHDAHGFDDVPFEAFDHGRWTGFELAGAHGQNECESCHVPRKRPDPLGRSFGRIAKIFGPVRGCATCHDDPHAGQFEGEQLPRAVQGRQGCARCHDEVSFRSESYPFDHGKWTGFPLTGGHKDVSCAKCHEPLKRPTPEGRRKGRAKGTNCADCHSDPHAGQFEENGATDCTQCHSSGSTFKDLDFDHDVDSRFPLDDTHEKLSCTACHQPWLHKGKSVVRYKPLGRDCTDCHGVNRSRLRPKGKKKP